MDGGIRFPPLNWWTGIERTTAPKRHRYPSIWWQSLSGKKHHRRLRRNPSNEQRALRDCQSRFTSEACLEMGPTGGSCLPAKALTIMNFLLFILLLSGGAGDGCSLVRNRGAHGSIMSSSTTIRRSPSKVRTSCYGAVVFVVGCLPGWLGGEFVYGHHHRRSRRRRT